MGARIFRFVTTAAILAIGFVFLLLGLGSHLQLNEARALVEKGAQADGVVTGLSAARRSTAYRITYRFPAKGRTVVASDRSIPYSMRSTVPPTARIRVWYDPEDPSRSMTAPELAEREAIGNRLFFPLAGIALIGWGVFRLRRRAPS